MSGKAAAGGQAVEAKRQAAASEGQTAAAESQPEIMEEIRISVRELVEFILRGGDIDNRHHASPEQAMQEGGFTA